MEMRMIDQILRESGKGGCNVPGHTGLRIGYYDPVTDSVYEVGGGKGSCGGKTQMGLGEFMGNEEDEMLSREAIARRGKMTQENKGGREGTKGVGLTKGQGQWVGGKGSEGGKGKAVGERGEGLGGSTSFVSARTICPCCQRGDREEQGGGITRHHTDERRGRATEEWAGEEGAGKGMSRFEGFRESGVPYYRERRSSNDSLGSVSIYTGEHGISVNTITVNGLGGNHSSLEASQNKGKGRKP